MSRRPCAVLVARSLQVADHVATRDWGWERTGQYRYRTADGEEVMAVPERGDALQVGQPRGTRIYLGPHWYDRDDCHTILERLRLSGWEEAMPPPLLRKG
jgi:hypothetical protein